MVCSQKVKLYPRGWVLYCPDCLEYIGQSDPQNFSGGKSVIIDDSPCETCIKNAQQIMGRLGLPKESTNALSDGSKSEKSVEAFSCRNDGSQSSAEGSPSSQGTSEGSEAEVK